MKSEVPEDDPFKNDLLGRKEPAEVLTHLVDNFEGPCVLAVDAAWGTGKTTFIRMWSQHLRNQGFPVVKFNAWETDFSGDPFVALATELTEGLRPYGDLEAKIDATKEAAKQVLLRTGLGAIRIASAGVVDLAPLLEHKEDRLTAQKNAQELVKKFGATLQDMANELQAQKGHPLVVVIDELDRCRPSYAVELLEVAKHLFSVDHIVFVLAVNRSELAHSIRALYGNDFDGAGYLRRFFDVDFRLPDPERAAFINALLDETQINEYFYRTHDRQAIQLGVGIVSRLLQGFFRVPDLSLRQIAQAIHRLGLVFASLPSNQRAYIIAASVAIILRTFDSNLYHRFIRSEVSDREVVDTLFRRPGLETLRWEEESHLFAAVMVLATREEAPFHQTGNSPLWQQYEDLANGSDTASPDREREHARAILNQSNRLRQMFLDERIGFKEAVQRIELLSSDFIDEQPRAASRDS